MGRCRLRLPARSWRIVIGALGAVPVFLERMDAGSSDLSQQAEQQQLQQQMLAAQAAEYQRQVMAAQAAQMASAQQQAESLNVYGVDPAYMVSRSPLARDLCSPRHACSNRPSRRTARTPSK